MSIDDIRTRASKLRSIVRRRNFTEYAVGAVLIVVFGAVAFVAETPLAKLGCAFIAIGVAVVMWQLHVRTHAASDSDMSMADGWAQFYRQELVRQRDALSGIWRWYLGPLIPGMTLYWLSSGVKSAGSDSFLWGWATTVVGLAATVVVFAMVASANKVAAKALQAEIDELDAARGS
ncbi:MAG: hypothetical protein K8S25_15145 [Alphaproteobacteria bacterium]|nr:hypothetical protein [Alphaproteobacteria bacterium]